jgi:protein-disulfide isomerase
MTSSWITHSVVRRTASTLALAIVGLAVPACANDAKGTADSATRTATASTTAPDTPVAEVDGKAVPMSELEKLLAPQLARLDQQRRKLLEDGVQQLLDQKLLEAEAAKRGVSVDDLVKTEIEDKAAAVSDADVDSFYEENKARINRPKEQIAPQIKAYLANKNKAELRDKLIAELRTQHEAKVLLEPLRADVMDAASPAKGPTGAAVTIVEFSDFQCPYCSRVEPSIDETLKAYPDQVRLVYRQFPLSIHPFAEKAAEAALCAQDQGKFWELHDAMFANQQALAVEQLKSKAAELGMNADTFDKCLDSGEKAAKIREDMAAGAAAGVNGTPALFVNGRFLNGAVPFNEIQKLVDDELARKGIQAKKAG